MLNQKLRRGSNFIYSSITTGEKIRRKMLKAMAEIKIKATGTERTIDNDKESLKDIEKLNKRSIKKTKNERIPKPTKLKK